MATLKWYEWIEKYLLIICSYIGWFLKWIYAEEVVLAVIGIIIYLSGHTFWGGVIIILAAIFFLNEVSIKIQAKKKAD